MVTAMIVESVGGVCTIGSGMFASVVDAVDGPIPRFRRISEEV
jgi:hypothetical protein